MVWGIISGIGKAIAGTVSKVVDTAKAVVGKAVETAKSVAKAVVESPPAREIQRVVNEVVASAKNVATEVVRKVKDGINTLVSANRIEDKGQRDKNVERAGEQLRKDTEDAGKSLRTIQGAITTIDKTEDIITKQEKKEEPVRIEREKELKTEFRKNVEALIEVLKVLPPAAFNLARSLFLELVDAYERDDKAKGWEVLRKIFRTEVSASPPVPLIAKIIVIIKALGATKVFWAVISGIAAWLGSALFAKFIVEEGDQRLGWAMDHAIRAGLWTRYKELREAHKELLTFSNDFIRSFLFGPFSLLAAYGYYFKASEELAKTYDELAKLEKPPEEPSFPGDIGKIVEEVEKNPSMSEKELEACIKPYLPAATILPKRVSTEKKDYESRIERLYFDIIDLKKEGNYKRVLEKLDELEKLLDEVDRWKTRECHFLKGAGVLDDVTALINDRRKWIADMRALAKERTIPTATLWIVCNIKPDRIWLNETPIEAFTSQKVEVAPGKHLIRAEKDGYHASSVSVEIKENETKQVSIEFIKKPQEHGYLTVKSDPTAYIYIGTNPTPLKTPLIRHPLPPGRYDLKLHLLGYRDEEFSVTILSGTETVVEKTLVKEEPERPEKGRLFVDTEPGGAWVFCDGIVHPYPTDTTLELDPGVHKIRIEKSGYETYETEVVIEKGKTVEIRHKLEPLPELRSWRVTITSEPSGALVYLDYIPTAKRTPTTLSLGEGTWTIGVELEGYYPAETTITLK